MNIPDHYTAAMKIVMCIEGLSVKTAMGELDVAKEYIIQNSRISIPDYLKEQGNELTASAEPDENQG